MKVTSADCSKCSSSPKEGDAVYRSVTGNVFPITSFFQKMKQRLFSIRPMKGSN